MDSLIAQTAHKIHTQYCSRDVLHGVKKPDEYWDMICENGLNLIWASEKVGGFGVPLDEVADTIWNMTPSPLPFVETLIANKLLEHAGLDLVHKSASFAIGSADTPQNITMGAAVHDVILFDDMNNNISHYPAKDSSLRSAAYLSPDGEILMDFSLAKPLQSAKTNLTLEMVQSIILTLRAVQMAAVMDGALSLSIDYVTSREQFGRPLAKFQAIQQQLAVAASQVAAAAMASSQACAALSDNIEDAWHEAVIAKVEIGHSVETVTSVFQQVHGAMGYTMAYDLHHYTRRLWAWRDALGNEHHWAQKLGESLAEKNSDQLWQGITTGNWK